MPQNMPAFQAHAVPKPSKSDKIIYLHRFESAGDNHVEQTTAASQQATSSTRFDWLVIVLDAWFLGGLYLYGWADTHFGASLKTFFTPRQAIFYSGFLAVAILLIATVIRNHTRGYSWWQAIPIGYELPLMGIVIFPLGSIGDLIWHPGFGIEGLLNPLDVLQITGVALIMSGPFRAAWWRAEFSAQPWASKLPTVLSLTFLLSVFTFLTQFGNPFASAWAAAANRPASSLFPLISPTSPLLPHESAQLAQAIGVLGILLQTVLWMGMVLLAIGHWGWKLPVGAITLMFTLNATLMGFIGDQLIFVPAAALTGIIADLLLKQLKLSVERPALVHLFASIIPLFLYFLYFLTLLLTGGSWWPVPLWVAAIMLSSALSWLLSHLVAPLQTPWQL
jgi:hypothetical protein